MTKARAYDEIRQVIINALSKSENETMDVESIIQLFREPTSTEQADWPQIPEIAGKEVLWQLLGENRVELTPERKIHLPEPAEVA